MRRCWLLLVLLTLAACRGGAPPPDSLAPTQTRAAALAELNRIPGTLTAVAATQTRLAELPLLTQVAATSTALASARAPSTPPVGASQPSPTARAANLQLTPTVTPIRVTVPATSPARRATPTKAGGPAFFDLVVDEARGRLYGSDSVGGRVVVLALPGLDVLGIVDLGQASKPTGMALSPDGSELAIALNGFGNIALVDPESLKLTKRLLPTGESGANQPYDVRYGGPRLLYSTGNPGSGGFDYIHVFDTETGKEVGRSTDIVRAAPRLAVTADGSIFVGESAFSPQQLYRYALKDNTPVQLSRGPHGPVSAADLAV
jgi:hypothetical protein